MGFGAIGSCAAFAARSRAFAGAPAHLVGLAAAEARAATLMPVGSDFQVDGYATGHPYGASVAVARKGELR